MAMEQSMAKYFLKDIADYIDKKIHFLVKAPEDNPSVGLILCRDENRTIAEYALRDMSKPIGVSEYHLCTDLPLDLKNALPAVEDIRSRIDMKK